jgi:hypothetical protein
VTVCANSNKHQDYVGSVASVDFNDTKKTAGVEVSFTLPALTTGVYTPATAYFTPADKSRLYCVFTPNYNTGNITAPAANVAKLTNWNAAYFTALKTTGDTEVITFSAGGVTYAQVGAVVDKLDCLMSQPDTFGNFFLVGGSTTDGWFTNKIELKNGAEVLLPAETSAHTAAAKAAPYSNIYHHAYQWVKYTITPLLEIPTGGCVEFDLPTSAESPITYCYLYHNSGVITP